MSGKIILLIEDEKKIQNYNRHLLGEEGYKVETAMTLAEARNILSACKPDAIILDIGMPDGNGLEFLRELRAQGNKIPVLLLTGYSQDVEIETGFDAGCDDYLPKPYTFGVLHRRLKRMLQSAEQVPETIVKGRLHFNVTADIVMLDGVDLLFTQKEFSLLLFLVQHAESFLSTEYLLEKVWRVPGTESSQSVRKTVSRIRDKIKDSGWTIEWSKGEGYSFTRE